MIIVYVYQKKFSFSFLQGTTDAQILRQYYLDAYKRIRAFSNCLLSVAPLLYQQSPYAGDWASFMLAPNYTNVVHEWHRYQIWGFEVRKEKDKIIRYINQYMIYINLFRVGLQII